MPTRAADFAAARLEHSLLPPHEATGFTSDSAPYAIGVAFTGHAGAVVHHADERVRTLDFGPGTVGVNGPRPLTWLRTSEPNESVEIVPTAAALARAADEHGVTWDRLVSYRQFGHDPVVWAACTRVRRMLVTGEASAGATEELLTALLAHVAVAYAGGRRVQRSSLDLARIRTVTDRIHADPWAPYPLHGLAASVHLSPYHFLRAFKATVGLTPHQYVTSVRAEHVRRLLASDGTTVSSVAVRVGVEPRQLRRLYQRAMGVSSRGR